MANELTIQERLNTALAAVPDYGDDAGAGMEGRTADELLLPRIALLQSNSKVCKAVKAARPGMLHNNVTGALFDGEDGIEFVPASILHEVVEWVPLVKGGGLVDVYPADCAALQQAKETTGKRFGKFFTKYDADGNAYERDGTTPLGNELVETYTVTGLAVLPDGQMQPAQLTIKSTNITPFKKLLTTLELAADVFRQAGRQPFPLYAVPVRVTVREEARDKGDSYNYVFNVAGDDVLRALMQRTDPRYIAAKRVAEMVAAGERKVQYENDEPASTEGGTPGKRLF